MQYEDKVQINRIEQKIDLILEKIRPEIFEKEDEKRKKM